MRKFRLMLVVLMVAGMYSCNDAATTEGTETATPVDSTHTHTDGESHEGHNH